MSDNEQDEQLAERYGDLLEKMRSLREAIARQRYPGSAWPARRRHTRRWVIGASVGAAAAAAVALVAIALPGRRVPVPAPPAVAQTPAALLALPPTATLGLEVPSGISLPPGGQVKLEVLTLSMPFVAEITPAVTLNLDVPTFSALSLE